MIKIAIKQMNSTVADFTGNTKMMIAAMQVAAQKNTDLLVFPELSVCGYYPYDLIYETFLYNNQTRLYSIYLKLQSGFQHSHAL